MVEGSLLGIYDIVERRNLERVDEQKLALSGILFEKSAIKRLFRHRRTRNCVYRVRMSFRTRDYSSQAGRLPNL